MRYSKHLIAVIGMMMMAAMLSSVVFASGGASAADTPLLADASSSASAIDSMTAFAPGAAVLPAQVKNLVAANTPGSGTSIDLRWVSGNPTIVSYPHYRIYFGTSHNPTGYTDVGPSTRVTVSGLTEVTTYYFKVAAWNASGMGPQSAEVSIMTNSAPNAPTWGSATPHLNYVDLSWIAPSSVGSGILYYKVYISDYSTGPFNQIGTASGTTYPAGGLDISTTYYFTVKGVNALRPGDLSVPISATTLDIAPNAAQDVTAVPDINSVDLSWNAPAPNGGSDVLGYRVYYGTTTPSILLGTYDASTFDVDVTGLAPATRYYFNVVAFNAEDDAPDATASAITPDIVPNAPFGIDAERLYSDLRVTVSWQEPDFNGGTAITGYMIYYGLENGPKIGYVLAGPSDDEVTITTAYSAYWNFSVVAVNAAGASEPSYNVTQWTDIVPLAPTALHTTAISVNYVDLAWTAPAPNGGSVITAYRVYFKTTGEWTYFGDVTGTTARVTGLTALTAYTFKVAAFNTDLGADSNEASATTINRVPGAPTITDATSMSSTCSVTWAAPNSNGGSDITGYQYRYRYLLLGWTTSSVLGVVYTATTPSLGLSPTRYYEFQVRAINAAGSGDWSSGVSANAVPSAPSIQTAVPGLNSVTVHWHDGASYYGSGINGYRVYYGTSPNPSSYGLFVETGSNTVTISGLSAATTYYFAVKAGNSKGYGAASVDATAITTNIVPGMSTITSVEAGYDQGFVITVHWTAPTPNGGTPILFYRIYIGTTPSPTTFIRISDPAWVSAELGYFSPDTTYYLKITAWNSKGESLNSTPELSVTTTDILPGAPSIASATPGTTHMNLVWTAPTPNGGSDVSHYRVYWGTFPNPSNIVNSMLVGNVLTYDVTGLNAATRYYFNVVAINSLGAGSASADRMSYTLDILPAAPTIGTVTPYYDSVDLAWTAPAPTGGSAISNYKVYYSTSLVEQSTTFITVGNVLTATVSDLDPDTTYYFRVAAVNGAGVGPQSAEKHIATADVVPLAPYLTSVSEGLGQLTVYWNAPADNRGSPIVNYYVYFGTDSPPSAYWTVGPGVRSLNLGSAPGVPYHFDVVAVNSNYESAMSNEGTGTSYTYPGAPTFTSLTSGPNQLTLMWSAPASNGYRTIDHYAVYRSLDGASWDQVQWVYGTSWTNFDLTAGTKYYYQVAAVNIAGEGPRSITRAAEPTGYMLQLTSPNGGENWAMGSIHSITWVSSGVSQNIKIELYQGGTFVKVISNGAPNTGVFRWTVTARTTGDYSIKISVVGVPSVYDFSNAHFHINSVVRSMALDTGVISAAPSMVAMGSVREVART